MREYVDLDTRDPYVGLIEETCFSCGTCSGIPANRITRCPDCGNYNRPCSGCIDEDHDCDWTRERGCWRFPFPSPVPIGDMVFYEGRFGVVVDYDCEDDGNDLSQFCAYHVDFGGDTEWEIVYPHDVAHQQMKLTMKMDDETFLTVGKAYMVRIEDKTGDRMAYLTDDNGDVYNTMLTDRFVPVTNE